MRVFRCSITREDVGNMVVLFGNQFAEQGKNLEIDRLIGAWKERKYVARAQAAIAKNQYLLARYANAFLPPP